VKRLLAIAVLVAVVSGAVALNSGCKGKSKWGDAYLDSLASVTTPVRSADNQCVTLETKFGRMTLELYRDVAPAHADSFLARTRDGFYTNTIFHRIVSDFMIQGGNPVAVGRRPVGYFLNAEFNDLPHKDGTLSMARAQSPNSAQTQFFICLGRNQSTKWLDGKYTVFGQLISGYDVLHRIARVSVRASKSMNGEVSEPTEEIRVTRAYVSDAQGTPRY
jgi:peptidyl-prolyl cis-trans isomerase B (cyclophilin B)